MIIGIDHGYYAIKTKNFSFPAGVTAYTHEPYTLKNTLQIGGKYFVCGTGRQPILRDKTVNDNYYILTLAAIAMELRYRGLPAESSVTLAAGLPLARYGRDKKPFTEYLLRNGQPVNFLFEGERYKVKIESVKLFPQGYSAIAIHPELVKDEPSVLLMDIDRWTVDLMRLDNNVPSIGVRRSCHPSAYSASACKQRRAGLRHCNICTAPAPGAGYAQSPAGNPSLRILPPPGESPETAFAH